VEQKKITAAATTYTVQKLMYAAVKSDVKKRSL
jgi:hypothetical protein